MSDASNIETGKALMCKICKRTFTRHHRLQSHLRSHKKNKFEKLLKERKKNSPDYNEEAKREESASQVNALEGCEQNLQIVINENKSLTGSVLTCKICNKFFTSKCFLERHLRIHTKEKPYVCEICGKGFSQKGNLTVHYQTHQDLKNFNCYICDKTFMQLGSLKAHILIHGSVMPYSCSLCGKGFTSKCFLERHYLTHSGEKPHVCSICNKGFAQKGNLTVHLRTHELQNFVYSCTVCEQMFKKRSAFDKHLKEHGALKNSVTGVDKSDLEDVNSDDGSISMNSNS